MRILVVGAGSTGGYFGMRLAQAGRDVTFLVRERRASQLRQRGLVLHTPDGEEKIAPQLITTGELRQSFDLVLFAVKATATDSAIEDVAAAVGPSTLIAPFLNGMAHLDALNARFGAERTLGGVIKVATQLDGDGDIRQLAPFNSMEIGAQSTTAPAELAAASEALAGAGFEFSVSEDIIGAMWAKWSFIATLGAFTCLMRGAVGDIVAVPGGAGLARAILAETAAVAAAHGHPVPAADLGLTEGMVTAEGSPLASSMYRDLSEGSTTEVEQILGDLTARGRAVGVATPMLDLATMHLRVYEGRR